MTLPKKTIKGLFLSVLCITVWSACVDKKDKLAQKFSIYVMMEDASEYLVQTGSLAEAALNPTREGVKVDIRNLWSDLIVKDGAYYRLNWKTETFYKYRLENDLLVQTDTLKLPGFSFLETYDWVAKDTILLITYNKNLKWIKYAKVNVNNMHLEAGDLDIPGPSGVFNWMSLGFAALRDSKLVVGYTYHTHTTNHYTTSDTAYLAVLNYPLMTRHAIFKDTRSTYPGGINTEQPFTFTDERGDFYYMACPGIALGNHPTKPTGLYRIRAKDDKPDPDYFLNISKTIGNHAYGIWYIGNGKAIIRSERKSLFTGMKDHYKVAHFDFYVLELAGGKAERLELPLDKGTARQCVVYKDGMVYISINSDKEGNYIWTYQPSTNTLKRGMELEGPVDYILRIEEL